MRRRFCPSVRSSSLKKKAPVTSQFQGVQEGEKFAPERAKSGAPSPATRTALTVKGGGTIIQAYEA